jgi:spermidine/putrescine transport system substrate-binding protein
MKASRIFVVAVAAAALAGAGGAGRAEAQELFLYNWSNYTPPDLLQRFEEETGIRVTLDVYDSNETLLSKLKSGATGYDVIVPSDYMVRIMIEEGLLEEIDVAGMPNFGNVAPPHAEPNYDPERRYSGPYMWGTTGFSYDTERVEGELDESWREFFEPREELRGQIAALNDQVEMINNALRYLGLPRCNENPEDMRRVQELLLAQKPYLAMYQSDGTIERMVAGEVIMHMQWNGAAHRTKMQKPSVTYVYPEEGMSYWADNFVVPKEAPHLEEAKEFINWMMDPRNAAEASNFTGYMNAIEGSEQYLDEALRSDPAVNMPEEYADRLDMTPPCGPEATRLMDRVWTNVKK